MYGGKVSSCEFPRDTIDIDIIDGRKMILGLRKYS